MKRGEFGEGFGILVGSVLGIALVAAIWLFLWPVTLPLLAIFCEEPPEGSYKHQNW